MNKHLTNKNLLRGITGLAIAGLAGAALSAGSVAASGTEICMEPGPDGIPRIVECPPAPAFIFPENDTLLDYFGDNSDDVDYGALLDYLGNTDSSDDAGSGFSGIEVPTPIDPSVFAQTVPEMVDPEQFEIDPESIVPLPDFPEVEPENPFLGTDDDAEPELAQPEAQPEVEVQPEAQPEAEAEPVYAAVLQSINRGDAGLLPEEILALADSMNLALIGASNLHGWGRTVASWSLMRIPGWQELRPEELADRIEETLHEERRRAVQVIERRIPYHGGSPFLVATTLPWVGIAHLRMMSWPERISWLVWISLFTLLGRRRALRRESYAGGNPG